MLLARPNQVRPSCVHAIPPSISLSTWPGDGGCEALLRDQLIARALQALPASRPARSSGSETELFEEAPTMHKHLVASVLFLAFFVSPSSAGDWRAHLSWCAQNDGGGYLEPGPCHQRFVALGVVNCITAGGRACLMAQARGAASAGDCPVAYEMAAACQCQSPGAESDIRSAGVSAVCKWLGQSEPP